MSVNYGPRIVTDGLVLCLDAGNSKSYPGTGTVWTDLSGNGNNGTLMNGPSFSSSNKGSIVFDGIDDYVVGGNTSSVNGHHTIIVWFNGTGAPSLDDSAGGVLFCQSTDINHGIFLSYSYLNKAIAYSLNINQGMSTSTDSVPRNTIIQAIGVYNGIKRQIFVNGLLSAETNWTTNPVVGGTPSNQIGRWGYDIYERCFNGNIYSVSLYNRALSSNEISQNYNALKGRYGL